MPTKGVHCVFMGNPPWVLGNILQWSESILR
jgi:hypothetical protein